MAAEDAPGPSTGNSQSIEHLTGGAKEAKEKVSTQMKEDGSNRDDPVVASDHREPAISTKTVARIDEKRVRDVPKTDFEEAEQTSESSISRSDAPDSAFETDSGPETSHPPPGTQLPAEQIQAPLEQIQALEQPLEVDSQLSDTDSALGDVRAQSSTASLRSSIYDYVEEHGRTYHAYNRGKYMLPNDEQEQERLDLQHHLFLMTFGLHLAPIGPSPHNVLDLATGTGIWAIDFANQYPTANVLGTDLSPIQPIYVPPNCRFEVSDAEEDWYYREKFDYIHGRALLSCFADPVSIARKAFDTLKPGGWYELQDPTPPVKCLDSSIEGTALQRWVGGILEGAEKLGRKWAYSTNYRSYMEQAGFVDIQEHKFQWPIGTWPRGEHQKTLGLWFQQDLLDGLQGMSMAIFMRGLGWTKEEFEMLLVDVRKDVKNRNIHAYVDVMVVYGRKPE